MLWNTALLEKQLQLKDGEGGRKEEKDNIYIWQWFLEMDTTTFSI